MNDYTTTNSPVSLIEMFLDSTEEEVYNQGRLATVPSENGVHLVAYGNEILATISGKEVTFYTGHHGEVSRTVTEYIKEVGSLLNDTETRTVDVRESEAPTLGIGARASDSAQYISNYIGDYGKASAFSPVERDAQAEVNSALKSRMAEIFG